MKTTIGITTHNCINATKMTLETLMTITQGKFDLIVVDNLSTDSTKDYLESFKNRVHGPKIDLVYLDGNYGCARSFNEVFKRTEQDDIVILANNDISFTPNWLTNLLNYISNHPEVGICSPHPIDNHIDDATKLKWFGDIKNYDRNGLVHDDWFTYAKAVEESKDEELDGFHGSAFAITRDCRQTVGLFDEQFKQGCWEDVDYCARTLRAGFTAKVTNSSVIFHAGGQTQHYVTVYEGGNGYQQKNRCLFEQKYQIDTSKLICSRGLLWDNSIPNINKRIHI